MSQQIPVGRDRFAIVDDEDFRWASTFNWRCEGQGAHLYAVVSGSDIRWAMHRIIIDARPGFDVDHINHDTLDNRRANLRECTRSQNNRNRSPQLGRRFKGVRNRSGRYRTKPWHAEIEFQGKAIYLGMWETEELAALAYDAAAIRFHGEFARLNFPNG